MQSLGDIFISSCNKVMRKRVTFLCRGKLEKIKQKERNRLPAHVTNVGIPMVNIDWTSCLECPQRRISRSIAALSLIGFKTMNMIGRKTSLREHPVFLSLGFFVHETSAEKKQVPSHSKEKHKRLNWATCLWARHNSTGSPIFLDFKSDLSRVARFPPAGQGEQRLLVRDC